MEIENIFSKINSRDYKNELEKILENKNYSETIENLLLSMIYKIEAGYKDYTIVKRIVESKKNYIEEIIKIIEEKCKDIIIVDEESQEAKEMKDNNFIVDKIEGKIYLKYPNERLLLYTLYELDDKQIYLDEKYNLIRISFSELLNAGENINSIEVLRDFNGWNWNTQISEISEISTNLIYQNLIYLLSIEFIKELIHTNEVVDHIELIQDKLIELYNEEDAKKILEEIYKISVIICVSKNVREFERLKDEKEIIQKELNRLRNKSNLLNEISLAKKEAIKGIKEIDNILNNNELLEQEFIKRNEKRAEYNKIFNLIHLKEILNKERKKLMQKIEEGNHLLEPKRYIQTIEELEKQLDMLKDIELEDNEKEERKRDYLIKLQHIFLECFNKKISNAVEKEEIITLIYMFRYYQLININKNEQIINVEELRDDLDKTQESLLKKAYKLKVLNKITNEENVNQEIIKKIISTRIISLENITIELQIKDTMLETKIYDSSVYEKTIVIPKFNKDEIAVKLGKEVKVFV